MVLSPDMIGIIVFSASVLGALGRALLPYLRKLKEASEAGVEPEPFAKKYVFSAVFSAAVATIVGILLFPTIIANAPTEALAGVFVYGFIAGWGATSLFNEVIATTTSTTPTTTKPEPTPEPPAPIT